LSGADAHRIRTSPFDDENKATWKKEPGGRHGVRQSDGRVQRPTQREESGAALRHASTFAMIGRVTDATSGAPVEQVCITPGKPGAVCWSRTDKDGWYLLDLGAAFAHEGFYEIFFVKAGYPEQHSVSRMAQRSRAHRHAS